MNAIPMKAVKSSSIAAYGYDHGTQKLAVQFKSGGQTYHYHGVPPDEAANLGRAKSIGSHIQAHIVGQYKHTVHASK